MKTKIDWKYDFRQHFNNYCCAKETQDNFCKHNVEQFRELVEGIERGEAWQATTDGGWPRMCWGEVLDVGMYTGWPHHRPIPSFYKHGPLGGEWHPFYSLTGAEPLTVAQLESKQNKARKEEA